MQRPRVIVGISAASGVVYAYRLLQVLVKQDVEIHLVVAEKAVPILCQELDLESKLDVDGVIAAIQKRIQAPVVDTKIVEHRNSDLGAAISSGSFTVAGMVIVPCSMSRLAAISIGLGDDLISRAASVMIKERRTLIVVPRETPLSEIHLNNMLNLCRAGAVILPAMPAFYHSPKSINDLVDFIVNRILDSLDMSIDLFRRWGE